MPNNPKCSVTAEAVRGLQQNKCCLAFTGEALTSLQGASLAKASIRSVEERRDRKMFREIKICDRGRKTFFLTKLQGENYRKRQPVQKLGNDEFYPNNKDQGPPEPTAV